MKRLNLILATGLCFAATLWAQGDGVLPSTTYDKDSLNRRKEIAEKKLETETDPERVKLLERMIVKIDQLIVLQDKARKAQNEDDKQAYAQKRWRVRSELNRLRDAIYTTRPHVGVSTGSAPASAATFETESGFVVRLRMED